MSSPSTGRAVDPVAAQAEQTQAQAQPTVLFVDAEPSILSAPQRLFRPQGSRVLMAASGKVGLALLEHETMNWVISDMRMPEIDGVQFLELVRQRWPQIMRAVLTGYADTSSTVDAINRSEIHRYITELWGVKTSCWRLLMVSNAKPWSAKTNACTP